MCALRAAWARRNLDFRFTARTSRETMTMKPTWYIRLWYTETPGVWGIGECAHFAGLSAEPTEGFEAKLNDLCHSLNTGRRIDITRWSSLKMGLETALLDLENGGRRVLFHGQFTEGESEIVINGLVWMGSTDEMLARIDEKLSAGFRCLKMKIGGVKFNDELRLLDHIRMSFPPEKLTLRLDANGAFTPDNAMSKLEALANFDVHSIEQPIRAGQLDKMSYLCENSPIPIALDEELIGLHDPTDMRRLLYFVMPQYIVLKPTLCGGLSGAGNWIKVADEKKIGWWITSALESNIGLNAIAQFTAAYAPELPQGLGTGALYHNNILSPLTLTGDTLRYNPEGTWQIPEMEWTEP
ncbi:MAG: o-succinylbenzoate synthase [Bacteroidales bacterium]|nr:o-succinylbenzoate synthase [Bacteroidales bacterium]MBD5377803.1 o-succinylbenzoate synthase [Bacteroides sp.]